MPNVTIGMKVIRAPDIEARFRANITRYTEKAVMTYLKEPKKEITPSTIIGMIKHSLENEPGLLCFKIVPKALEKPIVDVVYNINRPDAFIGEKELNYMNEHNRRPVAIG